MFTAIENNKVDTTISSFSDIELKKTFFKVEIKELEEKLKKFDGFNRFVLNTTEKIELNVLDPVAASLVKIYEANEDLTLKMIGAVDQFIQSIGKLNHGVLSGTAEVQKALYPIARWITVPGSYIFYALRKRWINRYRDSLYATGIHAFIAPPGGGKSSLAYQIAETLRLKTGKGSSFNTDLEKPRFDKLTGNNIKYHDVFEMFDKFGIEEVTNSRGETRTIATLREKFDANFLEALFFDEFISALNRRNNKSADYNGVFLAIFNLLVHKRHINKSELDRGIERIYFIQQIDAFDGLLDKSIDYKHEIEVDLDCTYPEWLMTGLFTKHILGWRVKTYIKDKKRNSRGTDTIHWKLHQKRYVKKTFEDDFYESRNQGGFYESLPEVKLKYNKKIERI